ncbi:hypothetical protein VTL71DRAFT_12562 [Oculimacula yallundae]|uniref:Uncharacterized protein n=1 Tax=Oculimacula yallundae TaxID=86028 RepID=A0ABR4CP55_9HELO
MPKSKPPINNNDTILKE